MICAARIKRQLQLHLWKSIAVAVLCCCACEAEQEDASTSPATPSALPKNVSAAQGPGAKRWFKKLREAHASADAAASDTERRAAVSRFRDLLDAPQEVEAADLLWVRQDVSGRIAEFELTLNEPASALKTCRAALRLSNEASLGLANLHLRQGQALEALGRKEDAIEAYHQALVINEQLMKRSIGEE